MSTKAIRSLFIAIISLTNKEKKDVRVPSIENCPHTPLSVCISSVFTKWDFFTFIKL